MNFHAISFAKQRKMIISRKVAVDAIADRAAVKRGTGRNLSRTPSIV